MSADPWERQTRINEGQHRINRGWLVLHGCTWIAMFVVLGIFGSLQMQLFELRAAIAPADTAQSVTP